jgi:hypothetical protein
MDILLFESSNKVLFRLLKNQDPQESKKILKITFILYPIFPHIKPNELTLTPKATFPKKNKTIKLSHG